MTIKTPTLREGTDLLTHDGSKALDTGELATVCGQSQS
jgi:hypothetical protein